MDELTPMMRQYRRIKQEQGNAILFFRLGDFYEMFEKDAREVSSLLNITLTSRNGVPMCGIPYHAAQTYVARLLAAGRKIAICEQISLPTDGKGIADRRVVQIITPGTVVDEDFLDKSSNNYLVAIGTTSEGNTDGRVSLASVDLSTGEFTATSFSTQNRAEMLRRELARLAPSEILIQESLMEEDSVTARIVGERPNLVVNRFPDWHFDIENSKEKLRRQFKVLNLKGFGVEQDDPALLATGVLLEYLEDAARTLLPHLLDLHIYGETDYVGLDEATQRNLEIVRNLQDGGRKYSLLEVLDHTRTAMGARKLKSWLLNPLTERGEIEKRQEIVENLYRNQLIISSLREELSGILDVERLAARVALDKAHAKDLLAIRNSLAGIDRANALLSDWLAPWTIDQSKIDTVGRIEKLLSSAIHDDPSILLTEGRLIKSGYNAELDSIRDMKENSRTLLDEYLQKEKSESGIANLRIRFNKIIGYYLEVTKGNLDQIPEHFIRRQSLVGSERFTTNRLAELESELNSATDRIIELEKSLFIDVREQVKTAVPVLLELADHLGRIDCLCSLAHAATIYGYTRPVVTESGPLRIEDGRHPVVEAHLASGEFVPNSIDLDSAGVCFALITGPNMAGKSTYLRQTALIVLMAHVGSFVPASHAEVGMVDRIFCRVGASDNLARGESTFLVEMNETSHILRSATERSLVIMDEVGRGTSTNDGLAIAWAVSEFLLAGSVKTLFATHFHSLTLIEHPRKINLAMAVLEQADEVVFLKQVRPGAADHSYGIHVAKLAGLPLSVVERATEVLGELIEHRPNLPATSTKVAQAKKGAKRAVQQGLFEEDELILREIVSLDVDNTTPLQALELLARWKKIVAAGRKS